MVAPGMAAEARQQWQWLSSLEQEVLLVWPPPPHPLPSTGATHQVQTPQSGNHLVSPSNSRHSGNTALQQNNVPHPHVGGPTQQIQNCHFGTRPFSQYINGIPNNRLDVVSTGVSNGCFSNPNGVIPVAIGSQPPLGHPLTAPPPPYPFQQAPNNGVRGQAFTGSPPNCNLQGMPPPIPFSTAGGEYYYHISRRMR